VYILSIVSIVFLLLYGSNGITQDAPVEIVQDEVILSAPVIAGEEGPTEFERPVPAPGTFLFISSEFDSGTRVKGAPYSAESITERVQVLGDGNRIVQKSNNKIFRDSEGRTRREQELGNIGPWAAAGEIQRSVFINDPVAKTHYILEPEQQIARKMDASGPRMKRAPFPPPKDAVKGENTEDFFFERAPGEGMGVRNVYRFSTKESDTKKESLGTQVMEGVRVEGTRTLTTIPAQQIGNERPIEIVSEKWYSPELQVQVMTRHSDPRFGETTYKLVNINRAEPDASLFQVPSNYKIVEDGFGRPDMVIKKKLKDKNPPNEN
jgi:hypothetical protein